MLLECLFGNLTGLLTHPISLFSLQELRYGIDKFELECNDPFAHVFFDRQIVYWYLVVHLMFYFGVAIKFKF